MSLFKNLIGKLFNGEEDKEQPQGILEYGDTLNDTDSDYKFAKIFTLSGGSFNYCGDETNAINVLKKIMEDEKISSFFCHDDNLQQFLKFTKTRYTDSIEKENDAAFITCEYLIAYDGKIMLSYNNILNYNSNALPEKIIIMANVSQIVNILSNAMARIQHRIKNGEKIKNLTSISGRGSHIDNLDLPNKKNPKLFLLLLED